MVMMLLLQKQLLEKYFGPASGEAGQSEMKKTTT
jgi:hypothetical protein